MNEAVNKGMSQRVNASKGFVDLVTAEFGGPRSAERLARFDAATPWSALVAVIAELPEYRPASKGGRPAWPTETMLRCLLLAKWFNLSDPQLEDLLQDRLSFRRFVGLSLSDRTPDETTFVRFRERLRSAGVDARLMEILNAHFRDQGLLVNDGVSVDATLVQAPRGRTRADGGRTTDPDAAATSRAGVPHFGYKAHLRVDRSKLVTACRLTDARTSDAAMIDELVRDEHRAVYADSAYESGRRRAGLLDRGVMPWIIYPRRRGQRRVPWHRVMFNHLVARVRAGVEHVMGELKQRHGWRKVRYRGHARNSFDLTMTVISMNLRRAAILRSA